MAFGCCNDFEKCSDAGRCIHEEDEMYSGCMYNENLAKGLNFYTKYNENNRHRAEKYRRRKAKEDKLERHIEKTKEDSKDTFIEIPCRLFKIGKRSKYGGSTYRLEGEEMRKLASELEKLGVNCTCTKDKGKFNDEEIIDSDLSKSRACCRIILNLNDQEYNISNYNGRALTKYTALKVASYLGKKEIKADIEVINGFNGNKVLSNLAKKKSKTIEKKQEQIEKRFSKVNLEVEKQMSIFEIGHDLITSQVVWMN